MTTEELLELIRQLQEENNNLISTNNDLLTQISAYSNTQATYIHIFLWLVFVAIAGFIAYKFYLLIRNMFRNAIGKNFF